MTEEAQSLLYVETNVFIYAVEGTKETSGGPRALIEFLRQRPGLAITSELTLAEVLAPVMRPDALPFEIKSRSYLDLLVRSAFVALMPITRDLLIETANLRRRMKVSLPDAIHIATAILGGCRYLVSNDDDLRKFPSGMNYVKPDELGIDNLLKALT